MNDLRVVAVHAHPDDEVIWTGGTLAKLARNGADVTVITCTTGELGEVIGDTYQALVGDRLDILGGFRLRELAGSLTALGINGPNHIPVLLGGIGAYRDSGMEGSPTTDHPHAFVRSGEQAVSQLQELLAELRPHLVITYDADGGYGHPDHIRAHEITVEATRRLREVEPDLYRTAWTKTDPEAISAGYAAIVDIPDGWIPADVDSIATAPGPIEVTLSEDDLDAKHAGMRAHATQIWLADAQSSDVNPQAAEGSIDDSGRALGMWTLSNLVTQPLIPTEHFGAGTADESWLRDVL